MVTKKAKKKTTQKTKVDTRLVKAYSFSADPVGKVVDDVDFGIVVEVEIGKGITGRETLRTELKKEDALRISCELIWAAEELE